MRSSSEAAVICGCSIWIGSRRRLAGRLSGGMKQKLALACALVPQPRVLLLDEPTTGVDPVSRREFWDTLAHLAAEGLTILVATPYLDEAERCRRVALIHLGEIRQIGAPAELRAGLRAKRLELRASNARRSRTGALRKSPGRAQIVVDVQRFGDRLDLLAPDPEEAKLVLQKRMSDAGLQIEEIRVDEPTLENTFVATLRALGQEPHETPFPCRHDHSELRGQVAIDADNLVKQFGSFAAVKGVSLQVRHGEIYGLARRERRGQDDYHQDALRAARADDWRGTPRGRTQPALRRRPPTDRLHVAKVLALQRPHDTREPGFLRGRLRRARPRRARREGRWVLSFSGLEGKESQITGSLPGGWKQRVAFGAAIMHEPRVLFLDEPTSGVDPLARRAFWRMINRLADAGAAILVTTHYLEESEQCNRLGLMVAGELVAEGSPSDIKPQQTGHLLEFIVDQPQRRGGPPEEGDGAVAGFAVRRPAPRHH